MPPLCTVTLKNSKGRYIINSRGDLCNLAELLIHKTTLLVPAISPVVALCAGPDYSSHQNNNNHGINSEGPLKQRELTEKSPQSYEIHHSEVRKINAVNFQ